MTSLILNSYLLPLKGLPPDAVAVTFIVPPVHKIAGEVAPATTAVGAGAITIPVVAVHPFASFTVIVYDPAVRFVKVLPG